MRASEYNVLAAAKMRETPELLQKVRELAHQLGWLTYHTHRSEKSERGFPDLVIIGHGRLIVRELKKERGRPTREQAEWIDALRAVGVDVDVWRPSDLLSGRIAEKLQPRYEDLSEHRLRERVADEICPGPPSRAHQIVNHGECRSRADRVIAIVRGDRQ